MSAPGLEWPRHRRDQRQFAAAALAIGLVAAVTVTGASRQAPPLGSQPAYVIDAVVVDGRGALVEDMQPSDFEVTVDGRRWIGVSLQRLYRGPGSTELALSRQARQAPGEMPATAEPSRLVLMIVDQASFLPGDEIRARLVAEGCLGVLGLGDRVAIMTLPATTRAVDFSTDREAVRSGLTRLRALRSTDDNPGAETPGGAEVDPARELKTREPERANTLEDITRNLAGASREVISAPAMKEHGQAVLDVLAQVFSFMRDFPGTKTVLLISAGSVFDGLGEELSRVVALAPAAGARLYAVQVPTTAERFEEMGRNGLRQLALDTGGQVFTLQNRPTEALQRLAVEMSFSYLLLLAPSEQAGDAGDAGEPRSLQVRSRRRGATVRAARFVAAGGAKIIPAPPVPPPPPAATARAGAGGKSAAPPAPKGGGRRDPALDAVIARATDYVISYWHEVSSVVSEEEYRQEVEPIVTGWMRSVGPQSRKLVSDFLLVKIPGEAAGWLPFRDVFEVDGAPVRDRQDRLVKLFIEAPSEAIENANRVWEESARYNIGPIYRNLNVPTLPLMFLVPPHVRTVTFRKKGEATLDGLRAWVVEYREQGRPTLIRTTRADADVPASGEFWVDPASGRVLKTVLAAGTAKVTVTYRPRPETMGLWMPVEMRESYGHPTATVTGTATYSKFRRFQVLTEESLKIRK